MPTPPLSPGERTTVEWAWRGVSVEQSCEEFNQDAWTEKIYKLLQNDGIDCDRITCPSTVTTVCGSLVADTVIQMSQAQYEQAQLTLAPLTAEKNTVAWSFGVAAGSYDSTTSPASYAAALAADMGLSASDITVTAVQNADGSWSVSVALEAGTDAVAAHSAAETLSSTTADKLVALLGMEPGSVSSILPATVAVEYGGVETEKNTVAWGFGMSEDSYDPATSPASYAAALAADMGRPFKASDFAVTAVQNADGSWSVSVEVDVGDDATLAQSTADKLGSTTPAQLESALGIPPQKAVVHKMTASGSVDDHNGDEYKAIIATSAGVDVSKVDSVTVEAGSVIITSTIHVDDAAEADAVQTSLTTNLGTAAAASAVLGITVESDPSSETKEISGGSVSSVATAAVAVETVTYGPEPGGTADASPPPPPTQAKPIDIGGSNQTTADAGPMIGGVVGGALAFLIILALTYVFLKKRREKAEAALWLKAEKERIDAAMLFMETPAGEKEPEPATSPKLVEEPPKPKPGLEGEGVTAAMPTQKEWLAEAVEKVESEPNSDEEDESMFQGDDDEPHSPVRQAFV